LFNDKIKDILKDISHSKVGRIEFGERCLVSGMVIQRYCPYNGMKLMCLNIIKKVSEVRNNKRCSNIRLTKLYNHNDFSFAYVFDENERLILEGS